jgi:hypothetical protein
MRRPASLALTIGCAIALAIALGSCGGSNSDAADQQQLEAAKKQGEEAAHEADKLTDLQRQVGHLKHQVHNQGHTVVVEKGAETTVSTQQSAPSVLRTFHAPSGNVSCEILSSGALCSVASINETFTFSNGEPAQVESGSALPAGGGELAPYGSTVSVGSISCEVPQSSEARGITCSDSQSGHGFEASRISTRQKTY